jgi:hypothetical protein
MPKQPVSGKHSDYLRFRPYRAFTAAPVKGAASPRATRYWKLVVFVGSLVLLLFAATFVMYLLHR